MNKSISRRRFLKETMIGIGALGFAGTRWGIAKAQETKSEKKIIMRKLGKTGIRLPIVSMGVMNASLTDLVIESYRMGVRHFDTAWVYQGGQNERMLGEALKRLGVRKEVVIATKSPMGEGQGRKETQEILKSIQTRLDESLQRLQTDYVDILYLHGVSDPQQLQWPELEAFMNDLKKKGKIRFCGVSCHANMSAVVRQMMKSGFWDVALVAFNFAMAEDTELLQTLREAGKQGIGLIAMKTQAGGRWWQERLRESGKLKTALNQTAMLKWVLQHDFITTAIPGYTTYEQLREDFSVAYDLTLTPEEKKFLSDNEIRVGLGFCKQCGTCQAHCPKQVDIPTLMRTHMYAFQYQNLDQAYVTIREITPRKGLGQCLECETCSAKCIHGVQIAQRIHDLKTLAGYQWC